MANLTTPPSENMKPTSKGKVPEADADFATAIKDVAIKWTATPTTQRVLIKSCANVSCLCAIFLYLIKYKFMKEGYVIRDPLLGWSFRYLDA